MEVEFHEILHKVTSGFILSSNSIVPPYLPDITTCQVANYDIPSLGNYYSLRDWEFKWACIFRSLFCLAKYVVRSYKIFLNSSSNEVFVDIRDRFIFPSIGSRSTQTEHAHPLLQVCLNLTHLQPYLRPKT